MKRERLAILGVLHAVLPLLVIAGLTDAPEMIEELGGVEAFATAAAVVSGIVTVIQRRRVSPVDRAGKVLPARRT